MEVHQNYFHDFIMVGSEILYPLYVVPPKMVDDVESHMHEYQLAGFAGVIGSTDATHIALEKCSFQLKNNHLGAKQHLATRSFNLTVNHHCQILTLEDGMIRQLSCLIHLSKEYVRVYAFLKNVFYFISIIIPNIKNIFKFISIITQIVFR
jgi:hypothetical protein